MCDWYRGVVLLSGLAALMASVLSWEELSKAGGIVTGRDREDFHGFIHHRAAQRSHRR